MGTGLPRVLILYTGGTFGMDIEKGPHKGGDVLSVPQLSSESLKNRLLEKVPELKSLARCDVDVLLNRDSAHLGSDEWLMFATQIQRKWKDYDGVVILHGTDTMPYTASALSFLLRPCLKPVVITGAQRPLSALRTDARTNLISAVEIAANGPREIVKQVTVFFGDKLFQGNRVRKKSATDLAAFDSPHASPLAVVGTSIHYNDHLKLSSEKGPTLKPHFSKKVMVIHVTPSFPAEGITKGLLSHLDGVVLVVFHSWTAPTHDPAFIGFLQAAKKQNVPIIIVTQGSTQAPGSETRSPHYAAGKELLSAGCFSAETMTPECAYVKTSLLLAQSTELKDFSKYWKQNLAREND